MAKPYEFFGQCPDGIDVYFENVGGPIFESVLPLLNRYARIPVCGLIAYYNGEIPEDESRISRTLMHSSQA